MSIYSALSIWVLFISSYAASKWETIFKYYFFISITTAPAPALLLSYISFSKYICVTVIT